MVGFQSVKKCPICETQVLQFEEYYSCMKCGFAFEWNGQTIQHHPVDGPHPPLNAEHDYLVQGTEKLRAMYRSFLSGRNIAKVSSFVNHGMCFENDLETDSPSGEEIARFLSTHTSFEQSKVIEFGCGRGGNLGYIADNFRPIQCVGVDLVEEHVALCSARFPHVVFIVGDAMQFSVNNYFTHALCVDSLLHYDNQVSFLLRAHSSLVLNGILMIVNVFDASHVRLFESNLVRTGFETIERIDVTTEVLASMKKKPIFLRKNQFYEGHTMIDRLQSREAQAMFYKSVKISSVPPVQASL